MDTVLQVCVLVLMTTVGLALTPDDFRRLGERPWSFVIAVTSQWLMLPLAALAVVWALPLPSHLVAGMILVASAPGGGISNYYTYLARADVALSVGLTAVTSLASVVTLPLIANAGMTLVGEPGSDVAVPFAAISSRLLLLVVLPISVGMSLRHRFPGRAARYEPTVRRASQLLLVVTVAWIVIGLRGTFFADLGSTILGVSLFTLLALAAGLAVARLLGSDRRQLVALMIEFACRNTAIPIMVGVAILGRPRLATFAILFFLLQMSFFMSASALANRVAGASSSAPPPTRR